MKSYLNEIFGPVLQIIEIDNIEGIRIINQNSFEMAVVFLRKWKLY